MTYFSQPLKGHPKTAARKLQGSHKNICSRLMGAAERCKPTASRTAAQRSMWIKDAWPPFDLNGMTSGLEFQGGFKKGSSNKLSLDGRPAVDVAIRACLGACCGRMRPRKLTARITREIPEEDS